ncbi:MULTISPECIES: hypothetical protein [Methylosinus]|uniref:Uncharacterized protein n=1 Tax=Methylosinus trichosporium (strain ATCC 35070 / NCIMB 11131 / UNIQEM 75 / OB3b) TaxID=595536 RepID=A0A2D2D2K0_METT3|nr:MULTISPECIES: hypothetical protein [Methylosinus]ATQ69194.1 hypothetical protein CQW49_15875 [Methylosinus trichosporium OB3b]OBS53616.1 hypothetical protein A8B73_05325 [Methylosinus sp. 3S-1]
MWPLAGFALGAVAGAAAVALGGKEMAEAARPGAKAAIKAALAALHEARVRQAELVEQAEDLFAEATAEVVEERTATVAATIRADAQKAAQERNAELVRRAEIAAAVRALYAESAGEPQSDRLAEAIAAAEERARAIIEAGRREAGASAETIDLSAIKRARAGGEHE